MSITVGVDSWVTISEANAYLTYQIDASSWFSLADDPSENPGTPSKESYLKMAFQFLLSSTIYNLSEEETNVKVKQAQIKLAFFFFQNWTDFKRRQVMVGSGIKSFSYSRWSEQLTGDVELPNYIDALLSDYKGDNYLIQLNPRDEDFYGD